MLCTVTAPVYRNKEIPQRLYILGLVVLYDMLPNAVVYALPSCGPREIPRERPCIIPYSIFIVKWEYRVGVLVYIAQSKLTIIRVWLYLALAFCRTLAASITIEIRLLALG